MNRDPLDERADRLFAAARKESPSEETRRGILTALRAQPAPRKASPWRRDRSVAFALAALSLGTILVVFVRISPENVEISAESVVGSNASKASKETVLSEPAEAEPTTLSDDSSTVKVAPSRPAEAPRAPLKPAPPTLEQELAGMKAARAALDNGDAASALAELDRFEQGPGWRQLGVEASLLRIEALGKLGKTEEARSRAARFIEENPNNPLVDRAAQFTRSSSSGDAETSENSESE